MLCLNGSRALLSMLVRQVIAVDYILDVNVFDLMESEFKSRIESRTTGRLVRNKGDGDDVGVMLRKKVAEHGCEAH